VACNFGKALVTVTGVWS